MAFDPDEDDLAELDVVSGKLDDVVEALGKLNEVEGKLDEVVGAQGETNARLTAVLGHLNSLGTLLLVAVIALGGIFLVLLLKQ